MYEKVMLRFIGIDILDEKMFCNICYGDGSEIKLEVL